ncbi:flagellar export chaperone FliS [Rhodovibrionaceae bacterium A322]
MNNAAAIYQNQQVMMASPAKLVAMLFDRAIRAMNDTIRCIDSGDIEGRCKHNKKTFDIINHLDMTLDMDRGGEVAQNLANLYSFILRKLPEIDFKNDKQVALDVIEILTPIRDSWNELAEQNTQMPGGQPRAMTGGAVAPERSSNPSLANGAQDSIAILLTG